jgi:RNA-directed DNA polymerase
MQREENPVMGTGLERIAAKARKEQTLQFTTIAHHVTKELIWQSLNHMDKDTAPGIDGVTVEEAIKEYPIWIEEMMNEIHRKIYKPPAVRRVWIDKLDKKEKRPLGVPCVADRALQRSVSLVLSNIYEEDFLNCSFGGRPGRGAHNALATLDGIIFRKKVNWVLEADLKGFFSSLDHKLMMKFVQQRIGDPRILSLLQRWLKAGVIENGELAESAQGTPQGGSISVLLSNIYLHYVLDLWFEEKIKPKLKGEAYLIRYLDDFIVCFEHQSDAERFYEVLPRRLKKFSLELQLIKTRLVEFGRKAWESKETKGGKLETVYFLGFTHYCGGSRNGNFVLGRKTEKSRMKRSIRKIQESLREIRHLPIKDQTKRINQMLQGHYAYYGIAGNIEPLVSIYNITKKYWKRMLSSRCDKGYVTWEKLNKLISLFPIVRPKIFIPYSRMKTYAML